MFNPGEKIEHKVTGCVYVVDRCERGHVWLRGFIYAGGFPISNYKLVKESVANHLEVGKTYKRVDGSEIEIACAYPGRSDVFIGVRKNKSVRLYHKTGFYMAENPQLTHSFSEVCDLIIPPAPVPFSELKVGESFHYGPDNCVSLKLADKWFITWSMDRWTTVLNPCLTQTCTRVTGDKAITLTAPKS